MKINVLSKLEFEFEIIDNGFIDNTNEKIFYLSILTPDDDSKPFREDSKDYKTLYFYDLEEPITENGIIKDVITDEQIEDIYTYVLKHSDYDRFIVHCTAGISRSGAVGAFVSDLLGNGFNEFKKLNPRVIPNSLISRKLSKFLY